MKIFSLMLNPIFGISLKKTPPINELYDEVLKNKQESKVNFEGIISDISDISNKWENFDFTGDIFEIKNELEQVDTKFEIVKSQLQKSNFDNTILSTSVNDVLTEVQKRIKNIEKSLDKEHFQGQDLIKTLDEQLGEIRREITIEIGKDAEESNEFRDRLSNIEIRQEEFIRMTKSDISELSKIEQHSQNLLKTIQEREERNIKNLNIIENFEQVTNERIHAQEIELRMLMKSMKSMQIRLQVDEFKEDKLQKEMTQMTLEMLNKISHLEKEIKYVEASDNAEFQKEKVAELVDELHSIENLVLYQQTEIHNMDSSNHEAVSELKQTDTTLRTKLSNVERDIHSIGSEIVFKNDFMKKFRY